MRTCPSVRLRSALLWPAMVGVLLAMSAPAGATTQGSLVQLPGSAGCISSVPASPADGCTEGTAFGSDLQKIAASPDGKNVYVTNSSVPTDSQSELGAVLEFATGPGGHLTQLGDPNACISNGAAGCTTGRALAGARGIVVSPDGKNVYVAAADASAIAVLDRHPDGTLSQADGSDRCISQSGSDGTSGDSLTSCTDGRGLEGVKSLAISDDGRFVYAIGGEAVNGIAIFERHADGSLTQLEGSAGCITARGDDGDGEKTCATAAPLFEPSDVVVSHDGRNVYVAVSEGRWYNPEPPALAAARSTPYSSNSNHGPGAVLVFKRDTTDGTLIQPDDKTGCLTREAAWDAADDPGCTDARGLYDAAAIIISPDDKTVYVAAQGNAVSYKTADPGAMTVFQRDAEGNLTQSSDNNGCVSANGSDGGPHYLPDVSDPGLCDRANGMTEPSGLAISSDGANVYSMNEDDNAVATFARDGGSGTVKQLGGTEGCIADLPVPVDLRAGPRVFAADACARGYALQSATKMVVVGCSAYVVSPDSEAVAAFSRCNPVSSATPATCSRTGTLTVSVAEASGGTAAKTLHFTVDGGAEDTRATGAGAPGTVDLTFADGRHTLEFWGEDELGRVETQHHTVTVLVDGTAPRVAVSGDQGTTEFTRGQTATITVTASDAASGLVSDPSAKGQPVPTDTVGDQVVQRTVTDLCGNTATATFRYHVSAPAVLVAQSVPAACVSRRVVHMQLSRRALRGLKITSVDVKLASGRAFKVVRNGLSVKATADLRMLPKGRFTVVITVHLGNGKTLKGTRHYRTCTPKQTGGIPKL
jgi:DNA-binding beta-propeller fold protein YncE